MRAHLGLKTQTCTDTLLTFKLLTKVVEHPLETEISIEQTITIKMLDQLLKLSVCLDPAKPRF